MELVVIRGDEQSRTDLSTTERNYYSEPDFPYEDGASIADENVLDDESGNHVTKGL